MASDSIQLQHDFPPFFRVHKTGQIERYINHDFLPPGNDPQTGVVSKDVFVSSEPKVSARLYLPSNAEPNQKLPLIIYIHGGAFSVESAFSSLYHNYVNSLASKSRSVVVSIEYRLAPEHPIPACYDDCWAAVKWVASHSKGGKGPDPWLNDYVDFSRVYVAGDSAGGNLSQNMAIRVSETELGIKFSGVILVHPFFAFGKRDGLWDYICPETEGLNDVRLNPAADMNRLSKMKCGGVLVCVAEKDGLRERGTKYHEALKGSDWKGGIELFETPGEGHVFHLLKPGCERANSLLDRIVSFVNSGHS